MDELKESCSNKDEGWYGFVVSVIPLIIFYFSMRNRDFSNGVVLIISGLFFIIFMIYFEWMLKNESNNIKIIKNILQN